MVEGYEYGLNRFTGNQGNFQSDSVLTDDLGI